MSYRHVNSRSNLRQPASITAMVAAVVQHYGRVDVLALEEHPNGKSR